MHSRFRLAALAAAVSVFLVACGGKPSATPAAPADGKAPADHAASDPDAALTSKLNAYIECFNKVDADIHRGAQSYVRWMKDPAAGPTGKETTVYGPAKIDEYDMKVCDAPMVQAAAAKPVLPALDAAAKRYAAALKTLQPLSNQVFDYYEREDYQDDAFAKGKQLHAPLMAALSEFAEASQAFNDELDAQNDAAQREQLKAMEQAEGRTREFYRLSMMLEAKEIVALLQEDAFDTDKATSLVDGFNKLSDEAHAKVADQEPGKLDWNSFETAAENFRKEGKARIKRVVEKTPYSSMEQGWLDNPTLAPEGSPGRLLKKYNDLVFQSNRQ
ncbi:YiiG family protein [Xanthomonas bonasiae]|uniref:YiiG family protein n=1 Tax=Xanthomonas bonasiae TaxID=2810351 RepID=UPI0017873966|nr:YiiG family protein [Xanthomonas surreyensis]MBD7920554.1 YiiG family protein [Xanthomonas surreyensis]